jgi:hypothetical protein
VSLGAGAEAEAKRRQYAIAKAQQNSTKMYRSGSGSRTRLDLKSMNSYGAFAKSLPLSPHDCLTTARYRMREREYLVADKLKMSSSGSDIL